MVGRSIRGPRLHLDLRTRHECVRVLPPRPSCANKEGERDRYYAVLRPAQNIVNQRLLMSTATRMLRRRKDKMGRRRRNNPGAVSTTFPLKDRPESTPSTPPATSISGEGVDREFNPIDER